MYSGRERVDFAGRLGLVWLGCVRLQAKKHGKYSTIRGMVQYNSMTLLCYAGSFIVS